MKLKLRDDEDLHVALLNVVAGSKTVALSYMGILTFIGFMRHACTSIFLNEDAALITVVGLELLF